MNPVLPVPPPASLGSIGTTNLVPVISSIQTTGGDLVNSLFTGSPLASNPLALPQPMVSCSAAPSATSTLPYQQPYPLNSIMDPLAVPRLCQMDINQVGGADGLIFSPALDPVPQRLVQRIQSGQYVELRDLLADNMTVRQRYDAMFGFLPINLLPTGGPRFREISSLLQWVYCFNLYFGVSTSDPVARDMLTYSRLLMCEAMQHGGCGWLQYDRTFCRQLSINPSLRWNTLQPALHASTIVGNSAGSRSFCSLCCKCEHATQSCALFHLQQPVTSSQATLTPTVGSAPSSTAHHRQDQRRLDTSVLLGIVDRAPIQGSASSVMCALLANFCRMAKDCPDTPEDSVYKWPRPTNTALSHRTTTPSTGNGSVRPR